MKAPSVLLSMLLLAPAAGVTAGEADPPRVLGYIGEDPITLKEVDDLLAAEMRKLQQQEYDLRRRGLDQIVAQRLVEQEAAARGITVEELFQAEIQAKMAPVTTEDVTAFYEQNKARIGDRTLESVRPSIENVLQNQRMSDRRDEFLAELRGKASIRVLLEPLRTEVAIPEGAPSRGPDSAPVTLVEFSDYQCPFCRRAHPALEEALAQYGDRVRFVYLDYPLPMHNRAVPASQAARCAGEQGKYWAYHENLMTLDGPLSDEDLTARAAAVGLEAEPFAACYASGSYAESIQSSMREGSAAGVDGTPTFFINGRMLSGALPAEEFKKVIDEELQAAGVESADQSERDSTRQ